MLFLRILDEREKREAEEAEAVGAEYRPRSRRLTAGATGRRRTARSARNSRTARWAPSSSSSTASCCPPAAAARAAGRHAAAEGHQRDHVRRGAGRASTPSATSSTCSTRSMRSTPTKVDTTHVFTLSQVYEGLLLKMGEKGNDGGQFFTPREIIRAMVRVVDPQDRRDGLRSRLRHRRLPGAVLRADGRANNGRTSPSADQLDTLKQRTFYGREKDNAIYPIALANLVLHGIDEPHIWHGNTLTGARNLRRAVRGAPPLYDVVLMNPPFGGKEGKDAQTRFAYKTGATQVLFLQHVIDSLKPGGRCGIVLDEGVLFRTNETAFVQTKRKLLDDCDLWCIVSLPGGVFTPAGAGVKTNLLFFTKGRPTERIWYYDLSDIKVGKKTPFTLAHFEDFFRALPARGDSERSWTIRAGDRSEELRPQGRQPQRQKDEDTRTPEELLDLIEAKGHEVAEALAELRSLDAPTLIRGTQKRRAPGCVWQSKKRSTGCPPATAKRTTTPSAPAFTCTFTRVTSGPGAQVYAQAA